MLDKQLEQLLVDNLGQKMTVVFVRGLYGNLIDLFNSELNKKDEEIAELKTKLAGYEENGAPYQLDTREGAEK